MKLALPLTLTQMFPVQANRQFVVKNDSATMNPENNDRNHRNDPDMLRERSEDTPRDTSDQESNDTVSQHVTTTQIQPTQFLPDVNDTKVPSSLHHQFHAVGTPSFLGSSPQLSSEGPSVTTKSTAKVAKAVQRRDSVSSTDQQLSFPQKVSDLGMSWRLVKKTILNHSSHFSVPDS